MKETQNFRAFLIKFLQACNNKFRINFIFTMDFAFNYYKVNK